MTVDARSTGGPGVGGRPVPFGEALAAVLRSRGVTQHELAARLGTGQSTISAWVSGRATPAPNVVFGVEVALGIGLGQLSRHLGYVPVDTAEPTTTIDWLRRDPALTPGQREALVAVYRELTGLGASGVDGDGTAGPERGA